MHFIECGFYFYIFFFKKTNFEYFAINFMEIIHCGRQEFLMVWRNIIYSFYAQWTQTAKYTFTVLNSFQYEHTHNASQSINLCYPSASMAEDRLTCMIYAQSILILITYLERMNIQKINFKSKFFFLAQFHCFPSPNGFKPVNWWFCFFIV